MLRKLALAAASALATLMLLELGIRFSGLELHDRPNDSRKYGSLLQVDEVGGYTRHPAGISVYLQGVMLRFNSLGMRDDEPRPSAGRPGRPPGTEGRPVRRCRSPSWPIGHTIIAMERPSARASLANFRDYDAPLATKLRLLVANNLTKLRTRSSCCGNLGQPGC